ncbi:MAG: glycosyltransferase family 4 protein [Prevotella sp.]|nr:glycosyltransferase family 4 protein [Prevotella sp.]
MKIGYDAKRYYHNKTGLGNYSRTLVSAVKAQYKDIEMTLYDCKSIERTFRLGRRAAKEGCTLFHGLSNELPRDIVKAGIPSIVTMHDVAWRTFPDMYKPIDRLIYDIKYGWSAKHATHVVCISESTKRDVMRFYKVPADRISVIYQPVQQLFYTPMESSEAQRLTKEALPYLNGKPFILTVGSINSRKNLMGMVQAYNSLPAENRPVFIVVGNGREYRRQVEAYISEHNLQNDIHIESNIHDGRILQALYSTALCMIYPSFYEGFGLPVVEAALQRCPVITSNVSSLPEAAGPDALLCDPSSTSELADALSLLINDSDERIRRGNACHDYCAQHFDPAILTNQMHELYLGHNME